ncbi:Multiple coagulation factor deficiency protein 2-like protein [Operophtera brumata]|uniref:Multiple coagulation factor deficiency protein 2-like protein n=1 Tax=Operophtera brumata TaxID=104452 RepID=A0A0L7LHL1_OPEBR|nr:Multiple coagulation factor deficiency protein 2-like protein [Operophtera brumata]
MRCEYCVPAGRLRTMGPGPMRLRQLPDSARFCLNATRVAAFLVLLVNTMGQGMRRGPHHPPGQNPVEQHHHHYKPKGSESLMGDNQILKMTPEELEFHYFSAHDFDRNSKLDGLELLKAIYHTLEHEHEPYDSDEKYEIERELDEFDGYIDGDGFVSYAEYRAARAKLPAERTPRVIAAHSP